MLEWLLLLSIAVNGLRLSSDITPLWLSANLTGGKITILMASLNYKQSLTGLCTALSCRRLALFKEYSNMMRLFPDRFEEIGTAFVKTKPRPLKCQSVLVNHQVIQHTSKMYLADQIEVYKNILDPLLSMKFLDFLPTDNVKTAEKYLKMVQDVTDFLIYVVTFSRADNELETVIESIIRVYAILHEKLIRFPLLQDTGIRQLTYLGWSVEDGVNRSDWSMFKRIKVFFCVIADGLGLEVDYCDRKLSIIERNTQLTDFEDSFIQPVSFKAKYAVSFRRNVVELAQRCESLLLYIKNFYWRISKSRIDTIFSLCGGGLLCEDYASHLVWAYHRSSLVDNTHHLVDAILRNSIDIYSTYCNIKEVYQFPEDHWAHAAALHARLGSRRGFLVPNRVPSPFILAGSHSDLSSISEARGVAETGLLLCTKYFFKIGFNPELSGLMVSTFADIKRYGVLCLRLRLDLKSWWELLDRMAESYDCEVDKGKFIEKIFGEQLSQITANELTSKEAIQAISSNWQ